MNRKQRREQMRAGRNPTATPYPTAADLAAVALWLKQKNLRMADELHQQRLENARFVKNGNSN